MTTEEKAIAYDEALEKAKKLYGKYCINNVLESLFPELRESEDELTWLTRFIKEEAYSLSMDVRDNEDRIKLRKLQSSLAWLEKQGEPKLAESEDEKIRRDIISYIQVANQIIPQFQKDNWIAWLEKQSEQVVILHKFKVGDWIVSKWGGIYQIKEVMSGSYNLLCTNNAEEINSITQVDNNSRLLCINDIKKLEKQTEQKWSEEDEIGSDATIELLEYFINHAPEFRRPTIRRSIDWLKSLKQRMEE